MTASSCSKVSAINVTFYLWMLILHSYFKHSLISTLYKPAFGTVVVQVKISSWSCLMKDGQHTVM